MKSATEYIETNDLIGCYERFQNARSNWKNHWWETVEAIFNSCKEWAESYILNPITKTLDRIYKKVRNSKYNRMINANGWDIDTEKGELCYLFEFYDSNNDLICSKVGTTTRTVRIRLKEELQNKTYKNMNVARATVYRVYECGDLPAEGLESRLRAEYIKQYPQSFKKNDRFMGEHFDFDFCDTIAKEYLN